MNKHLFALLATIFIGTGLSAGTITIKNRTQQDISLNGTTIIAKGDTFQLPCSYSTNASVQINLSPSDSTTRIYRIDTYYVPFIPASTNPFTGAIIPASGNIIEIDFYDISNPNHVRRLSAEIGSAQTFNLYKMGNDALNLANY